MKEIGLNKKLEIDEFVLDNGSQSISQLDDFKPLSRMLKTTIRALFTLILTMVLGLTITFFLTDHEKYGISEGDSPFDALQKFVFYQSTSELVWGILIGLIIATCIIYTVFRAYALQRRLGWTTVATSYELEAALNIRPTFGMPRAFGNPHEEIDQRSSEVSEALMSLETLLSRVSPKGIPHSILITSSRPNEGKTTLAYGLAKTLSRLDKKVLLIDADLRNQTLWKFIDSSSVGDDRGLVHLLAGATTLEEVISTDSYGLDFISGRDRPPNPAELLSGDRFRSVLDKLANKYDHVVIDSAPVMGLADTVKIAHHIELVLYAIEANRTWVQHALEALKRLGSSSIIPIVTKIPIDDYGYTFGYGYGYGYGYGKRD